MMTREPGKKVICPSEPSPGTIGDLLGFSHMYKDFPYSNCPLGVMSNLSVRSGLVVCGCRVMKEGYSGLSRIISER